MKKKLNEVFVLDEGAIDRTRPPSAPRQAIKYMGIDPGAVETVDDVREAIAHLGNRLGAVLAGLAVGVIGSTTTSDDPERQLPGGHGKQIEGLDVGAFKAALNDLNVAVRKFVSANVTAGGEENAPPAKDQDPRTGWADDPNPKTANKTHPYRGYRSG